MKSKKVTMLAAALVVAVVAFAAVGYATTYTAKTTNTNNSLNSTYITLSQDTTVGYAAANIFTSVYFDTEKTANTTIYTPVCDYYTNDDTTQITAKGSSFAPVAGKTYVYYEKITKDLELTLDKTNSAAQNVKLTVTATNFTPISDFHYILVLTTAAESVETQYYSVENSGSTWTFSEVNIPTAADGSITFVVSLYVYGSYSGTTAPTTLGFNTSTTSDKDSQFIFEAEATGLLTDGPGTGA